MRAFAAYCILVARIHGEYMNVNIRVNKDTYLAIKEMAEKSGRTLIKEVAALVAERLRK